MYELARLAGYFAAHAVWSVSDGGPLITILAYELKDGHRGMDRLVVADSSEAQTVERERLQNNAHRAARAVLLYDAFVNAGSTRRDAIVIEGKNYETGGAMTIVVPYRTIDSADGFGVYPAELVAHEGLDIQRTREVLEPFFNGVDAHEKGAPIWNANLIDRG